MTRIYRDRSEAGRALAAALADERSAKPVVLGLARGGVPVAFEVAAALGAPLDVMVVRKLGVPWQPELAMGAIASGGVLVRNDDVLRSMPESEADLERIRARELDVLEERDRRYRAGRPPLEVRGRRVILVDDGIATGASLRAAARALRARGAGSVVIAVPVAPRGVEQDFRDDADRIVCLQTPANFMAVGQWYDDFGQTSDEEVEQLLARAAGPGSEAETVG
jgi:predicted phosphoribosyltransferase